MPEMMSSYETVFVSLLAPCKGNLPATGGFPMQSVSNTAVTISLLLALKTIEQTAELTWDAMTFMWQHYNTMINSGFNMSSMIVCAVHDQWQSTHWHFV